MDDETNELEELRKCVFVTQAEFAVSMGLPLRTYEDLARGRANIRTVHVRAAELAALQIANDRLSATSLPAKLQDLIRNLADQLK